MSPPLYGLGSTPEGPKGQPPAYSGGEGQIQNKTGPRSKPLCVHLSGGIQDLTKPYILMQARPSSEEEGDTVGVTEDPEMGLMIHSQLTMAPVNATKGHAPITTRDL